VPGLLSSILGVAVLALRLRHHVRGPKGDYLGLWAAALASWVGVPGPGEAALITGGVLARKQLDIGSVLAVAWVGGVCGGTLGWLIGLKAGRTVMTARGPFLKARRAVLARGDRFYQRYGLLAVFFTPAWVAGVHRMRWTRFVPVNAFAALTWSLSFGLGAYLLGPSITDILDDIGLAGSLALVTLILVALGIAWRRRTRRIGSPPE
jgi:membrane protein DedA with SNARE-associated domain